MSANISSSKQNNGLQQAVRNMLVGNMNLKDGERVLFVTDIPRPKDWNGPRERLEGLVRRSLLARQLYDLALEDFPHCSIDFLIFPATGQNGVEPPEEVAARLQQCDVVLLLTTFSLSHTEARSQACKNGVRIASMPEIELEMFLPGGPMQADYNQIFRESQEWAEKLSLAKQVQIVTTAGTDFSFSVSGRSGKADHGLFHQKGDWGNLPAGEAYTAPLEGTATGKLVVPAGWYPRLVEDMILTFKDGEVVALTGGGEVGKHFTNLFRFGDEAFRHRRNCAELGIGVNPNAKRPDNVLEAEKIRGTIHIAVGDNAHMGGVVESDIHEDFVIPEAQVYFDRQKVMG